MKTFVDIHTKIRSNCIFEMICGGPEKGLFSMVGRGMGELKPWTSQTSWAEERPGCWAELLPGR